MCPMPPARAIALNCFAQGNEAPLRAHLRYAVVLAHRLHHPPPLDHRQAERLFDVNVLTGLAGVNRLQGVPMIRSADDDGVRGGLQQLAVVRVKAPLSAFLRARALA